jgi:hypothetical protein
MLELGFDVGHARPYLSGKLGCALDHSIGKISARSMVNSQPSSHHPTESPLQADSYRSYHTPPSHSPPLTEVPGPEMASPSLPSLPCVSSWAARRFARLASLVLRMQVLKISRHTLRVIHERLVRLRDDRGESRPSLARPTCSRSG